MKHFKDAELIDIEKALDALNLLLWDIYEPKAETLEQKIQRAEDGLHCLDQDLSDPIDGAGL